MVVGKATTSTSSRASSSRLPPAPMTLGTSIRFLLVATRAPDRRMQSHSEYAYYKPSPWTSSKTSSPRSARSGRRCAQCKPIVSAPKSVQASRWPVYDGGGTNSIDCRSWRPNSFAAVREDEGLNPKQCWAAPGTQGTIHSLLSAAHEGGELGIEADDILEERRVADALIDRELGARDHLGGVFGGDQVRVLVLRAVRHQHRKLKARQNVVDVKRPVAEAEPHLRRHHHVESEHGLVFLRRRLLGKAVTQKSAGRRDVDGEDRALDTGRIHHRLEFVGPGFGILVAFGLKRLVGIAMATQIVRHHVEVVGELAGDLLDPRQMALRKAVNEDDLGPGRIAPVLRRDREPVRCLHPDLLEFLVLRHARHSAGREDERGNGRAGEAAHKRSMRHGEWSSLRLSAVFPFRP